MSTVSTTGSTELDSLVREFKKGYTLERTGGGHYRVRDSAGRYVEHNGKVLSLTGTAHGGRSVNNMRAQLKSAGVLQGTPMRSARRVGTDEEKKAILEAQRRATAERARAAQARADALYERLSGLLAPVGTLGEEGERNEGVDRDLAWVGSDYTRRNGSEPKTPDLMATSIWRVARKLPVVNEYHEIWESLANELEQADDVVEEWFKRVREARGLEEATIKVGKPATEDWPFEVQLLPIESLMVDHDYQRPVPWAFVRKNAAVFDEPLVGTIDVAERRRDAVYAIMDGQLRYEMCRLVGKETIWCSVYKGMDRPSEARFFLHKNKDKKVIHPYYTFKARLVANDPDAKAINEIVKEFGYELSVSAASEDRPQAIAAIAAVEEAYSRKQENGHDSLHPALRVLKRGTWGLRQGQSSILIRGVAIVFQTFGEELVGIGRMQETLRKHEPELLLGRAREAARHSSGNSAFAMARLLASEYDRGLPRAEKLGQF